MPDVPSGRQRLKHCARLIEHHLSDLQLIFDKELLNILGSDGTQYIDIAYLQEVLPALGDLNLNAAQLRRAIKYDAKDRLELHPELDMVRRCRPFSEAEALDRMLFVDDIDITGHEDDPQEVFQRLLLPYPESAQESSSRHDQRNVSDDNNAIDNARDNDAGNPEDGAGVDNQESLNHQTIIRPYGYKPTRFFQGFCYVEFASIELSSQMTSRILARNNSVRVMPM
ncbi:hypothetical protein KVV02_004794 [Mortierella alpina]|uniref:Uncharacterized protein n=1 Tax=Mortierella alpina TaxID=64518 RepID=A0A9P8A037_MORAP|nr:hypothetical protein KVV02_004794 [Mortierella alpina]